MQFLIYQARKPQMCHKTPCEAIGKHILSCCWWECKMVLPPTEGNLEVYSEISNGFTPWPSKFAYRRLYWQKYKKTNELQTIHCSTICDGKRLQYKNSINKWLCQNKLNRNLIKSADITTNLLEIQETEKHVKWHHQDVISKIQTVRKYKRQTI